MFSPFFHPEKVSAEKIEHAALLALEIFAVVTANVPAALTVMAVHALIFVYEQKGSVELDTQVSQPGMHH